MGGELRAGPPSHDKAKNVPDSFMKLSAPLVDIQREPKLGRALLAIFLAEFLFPPLELGHLLFRALRQTIAARCFTVRVFRHDLGFPCSRNISR